MLCTFPAFPQHTFPEPVKSASEIAYPPFSFVTEDGRADGFSVELMRAALAKMGREVTFRTGAWAEVRALLEKGEIDALPLVGRTPEREALFDFTVPYLTMHGAIVVRDDTNDVVNLTDLQDRRVGVMEGDNAEEFLHREERGIEIVTFPTFPDAFHALSGGDCDAVVIQRLVALRLIAKTGLQNLRIVERPVMDFQQDFCFAVQEGDSEMLALLNEGLALVVADGTRRRLHAKWFAHLQLPVDRPIIIGGDYNYPPFEFLDENGRPAGYNVDLVHAVADAVGLDISVRLGPWPEIMNGLERGEIDAIQGMFYSPERDKTFDFSQAHIVNNCVSVVREGSGVPPSTVEALEGKRIVLQKGDIMHGFAVENGLTDQLVLVDSQEEALERLAAGEFDCALVARMTAFYWIEQKGWDNLVVGRDALASPEYCFAVPNGNQPLLAELSEGLSAVSQSGEYHRIQEKWMGVYEERANWGEFLKHLAYIALPLVFLTLLVLLWSWSLRRQVRRQTAELRRRQKMLARTEAVAHVGSWEWDPATDTVTWSDELFSIFGRDPADGAATFAEHDQIYHPDDLRRLRSAVERALKEGTPYSLELRAIRSDGEIRNCVAIGYAEKDTGGNTTRLYGSLQDVTELRAAEAIASRSEEQYRQIAERTIDCIWVMDMNLVFTYTNPAVESMFDYTPEEFTGTRLSDHCSEKQLNYMQAVINKQVEAGPDDSGVTFETALLHREGTEIPVEINGTVAFDPDGNPVSLQAVVRDISERRKRELELRESEERLREAQRLANIGSWEWDLQTDELIMSEEMYNIIGLEHDTEALNAAAHEKYYTPETWQLFQQTVETARETGEPYEIELEVVRPGGSNRHVVARGEPVKDQAGGIVKLRGTLQDITSRVLLQKQLNQAQKMESVGRLAGGIAHDFNNLLMGIMNYAELCGEEISPDHPVREWLDEIMAAADRSANLTRQLLTFARKQTIEPEILDLNETIEVTLKLLRRLIGEDIDLSWRPRTNLWPVRLDPGQADQILANLCVNARDAISGVGKVTIETANADIDASYCAENSEARPGEYVLLAVSDNGRGMDRDTLEHIFEPFYTTKQPGVGTGLGLATVYGIVKQNNGFINVYSEPGEGTTFRVYLPRYEGDGTGLETLTEKAELPGGNETILLVEDEKSVRVTLSMFLERSGFTVITAETPGEALAKAAQYRGAIHMMITDVVMPGMNGRDLAKRAALEYPEMKVLYISGYTADVIAHRGMLEDNVEFLSKPFSHEEIIRKVREILG